MLIRESTESPRDGKVSEDTSAGKPGQVFASVVLSSKEAAWFPHPA